MSDSADKEVAVKKPETMKIPRRIMTMGIEPARGPGESTVLFALSNDGLVFFRVAPGDPESYWKEIKGLPDQEVPIPTAATGASPTKEFPPTKPGQPRLRPLGGEDLNPNRPNSGL